MAKTKNDHYASMEEIQAALGFSDMDAALNGAGKFTDAQLHRLKQTRSDSSELAKLGIFIGIPGVLVTLALYSQGFFGTGRNSSIIPALAGVLVLVGIGSLLTQRNAQRDIQEQRVASVKGALHVKVHRRSLTIREYRLRVASFRHEISENAYWLLTTREGEQFKVYFSSHSKTFLSLKPVERKTDEPG